MSRQIKHLYHVGVLTSVITMFFICFQMSENALAGSSQIDKTAGLAGNTTVNVQETLGKKKSNIILLMNAAINSNNYRSLYVFNWTKATVSVIRRDGMYEIRGVGGWTWVDGLTVHVPPNSLKTIRNMLFAGTHNPIYFKYLCHPEIPTVMKNFITQLTYRSGMEVKLTHDDFNVNIAPVIDKPGCGESGPYIGCFAEDPNAAIYGLGNRVLNGAMMPPENSPEAREGMPMSSAICIDFCRNGGWKYAGTQYGGYCFCGNSYDDKGPSSNCTMTCTAAPNEICGGSYANSVYLVE